MKGKEMKKSKRVFVHLGAVMVMAVLLGGILQKEYHAEYSSDITKPVIESVEFPDESKNIAAGSYITVVVNGYDADSGLRNMCMTLVLEDGSKRYLTEKIVDFDENGNTRISVRFQLEVEYVGTCKVESVSLEDMNGNIAEAQVDFPFIIERKYLPETTQISFQQDTHDIILDNQNPFVMTQIPLEIRGEDREIMYIVGLYETDKGVIRELQFDPSKDYMSNYRFGVSDEGTFTLKALCVRFMDGTYEFLRNVPKQIISITNLINDKQGPVLTEIIIDKQGQYVKSGEVTVTAYVSDPAGVDRCSFRFEAPLDIDNTYWLHLEEDENEPGKFVGKIPVKELYACEWYLDNLYLEDNLGNITTDSRSELEKHYFFVNKNNKFVAKVYKNTTVIIYDKNFNLLKEITTDVVRRSTLKEIFGGELSAIENDSAFLGWSFETWSDGGLFDGDTPLNFLTTDNETRYIYAKYDKNAVEPDTEVTGTENSGTEKPGTENPDTEGAGSEPETEPIPETKPVIKLEEEKIAEIKNQITEYIQSVVNNSEAQTGVIEIEMKKEDGTVATEVPKEILEAAKGENVTILFDMGDYSWSIQGGDIKGTDLENINLEVTLDTQNIPPSIVDELANGEETYQISLTHNGDFGFKADLKFNLGAENAGQYGNLYYYDSDGKMIFINAGMIDENGYVDLSFSHASEYVVVISAEEGKLNIALEVPKTLIICAVLGVVAAVVFLIRKKRA